MGRICPPIEEEKAIKPEFAQWLTKRRYTAYRRDDLTSYATGTLGHAIWEHLSIPGMEIELKAKGRVPVSDLDYLEKRRATHHDIEHIVTGFGLNFAGELARAFVEITSGMNYFTPALSQHINASITLISASALQRHALQYPDVYPTMLDATRQGIEMGQARMRPLLFEDWEDMLDWPMDDLIDHLGIIKPGPGKGWDWTTAAASG